MHRDEHRLGRSLVPNDCMCASVPWSSREPWPIQGVDSTDPQVASHTVIPIDDLLVQEYRKQEGDVVSGVQRGVSSRRHSSEVLRTHAPHLNQPASVETLGSVVNNKLNTTRGSRGRVKLWHHHWVGVCARVRLRDRRAPAVILRVLPQNMPSQRNVDQGVVLRHVNGQACTALSEGLGIKVQHFLRGHASAVAAKSEREIRSISEPCTPNNQKVNRGSVAITPAHAVTYPA